MFSIEPCEDGFILYFGRDDTFHGMNLCKLLDFDAHGTETRQRIVSALNAALLWSKKSETEKLINQFKGVPMGLGDEGTLESLVEGTETKPEIVEPSVETEDSFQKVLQDFIGELAVDGTISYGIFREKFGERYDTLTGRK